jgi:hypothetical protein
MKVIAVFAMLALCSGTMTSKDRTITQVVKLLQGMLEKSKKEGDEERKIYAKFKCYCDTSEAEKTASIKKETENIGLLESKIEELQGDTGGLSSECADLKATMADNKQARSDATTLREKENKAFKAEKADLEQAIKQMKAALEVLSAVGADQTKSTGADNKQFMAGKGASMLSLQAEVEHALNAASALMSPDQKATAASFLQAPFTGTYTSQSAQVLGIIKSMRDTFKANLADAIKTEKDAKTAYDKFMDIKEAAFKDMAASYKEKQEALGGNDEDLATKKKQLSESKKQKASDEEFLEKLLPLCEDKAQQYQKRNLLRANEEAAIAQAISILNSDDAFATFGTTDATSTGSTGGGLKFLQLRSVHKHMSGDVHVRNMLQKVLQTAAKETQSSRLSKVLASVKAENPFTEVLGEIDKMIDLIVEEGKSDKENLDWCNKERKENKASLKEKKKDILALEKLIDELTTTIEDPKTGLKAMIAETEESLVKNTEAQKTQTGERTESNLAYQADVKNLVAAEGILDKAIKVLKTYYDDLEKKLESFVQEDPNAPEAKLNMKGQSDQGGDVIEMLEFILSETKAEEMQAHSDEEDGQAKYEDSMAGLKKQEASDEKRLSNLQEDLAEKEKDLLQAQEDLKATTEDKEAIETYLLKIKPGCDFITKNVDLREKNRATEKAALEKAIKLIKATPAYKTAVNAATVESYGDCKEPCTKDENHVECKACMADVTIPAYCAGHKGTAGC